ncbi:MAG: hypothetical protein H0U86_02075 [Chloroflexi bacterium]|nr:hypothetical protein [Chloroflexota bacterium]
MFETAKRRRARPVADIVPLLARQFLVEVELQARLPTVRDLAREHRSSLSSVHAAIGRLEEAGGISIETRGRLGAFLIDRSVARLWTLSEGSPLVVAMPLASSPRYEALATALKQVLSRDGLDVFLIFVRGSRQRLQAVRERRCHLAAMSAFAAGELCRADEAPVIELGPNSYNTGHRVFYSSNGAENRPYRVIVDPHSADQQLLTALEFADRKTKRISATSTQIARLLEEGQGDAAVWTVDEMRVRWPDRILDRPLSPPVRERIGDRDTRAVLIGRNVDIDLLKAITSGLDPMTVEQIEADVLEGRLVAEY